ncbi:MAG: preprotein translocase subunit YajC [Rikenellaceae bacterium]|nr:preprotein translocase subunit YajC [Rikenellaceae bacterium]
MISTLLMGGATGGANAGGGGDMTSFVITMVLIFAVMYFLMIRPQQKRQKELNKFRESLTSGTKVITAGGIYGTIRKVDGNIVYLEVAKDVEIKIDRSMIMRDNSDNIAK